MVRKESYFSSKRAKYFMHKVLSDRIIYDHEVDDNLMYEIPIFVPDHDQEISILQL